MSKCALKIVELFSGIGSQAKALKNLNVNLDVVATCEWNLHSLVAYELIHAGQKLPAEILKMRKEELITKLIGYVFSNSGKEALPENAIASYSKEVLRYVYASLKRSKNFVDISSLTGQKMPSKIDILTYSFPCQDLSNVGAFHGYMQGIDKASGSRSSLLWQVGRILLEMKTAGKTLPRFLLMENVPTLLSARHRDHFNVWIEELKELGYISKYFQLNALDFGAPQNRPRLLMISVLAPKTEDKYKKINDYLTALSEDVILKEYKSSRFYNPQSMQDLLRLNYADKELYNEALECTPNDTPSRRKIWKENPKLVLEGNKLNPAITFIRTITTKQDRNPNSGNLYFECDDPKKGRFRYLTPRECLLFMGFTDNDYLALKNANIENQKGRNFLPRDQIIKMAGNSIPVKLLEGIFLQILKINTLFSNKEKAYSSSEKPPMKEAKRQRNI